MAECYKCPYKKRGTGTWSETTKCNLTPDHIDVSYYCLDTHKEDWNPFCPFENPETRFRGVDYRKYETENLQVKEKQNEIL